MTRQPTPFRLEQFLAAREFNSRYMFCASDMESRSISEVLNLLPEAERQSFFDLSLSYTTPEGSPELRRGIASMYSGIEAKNVLCFAGAEEGIYTAAKALLGPADHATCITPCYQSLYSVAESVARTTAVPLCGKDGIWNLDPERIIEAIRPETKMLFINFPHNPTGYIPPKEVFQEIINLAKARGVIIFSDEVYRGLELDPANKLASASELYDDAVSLGVLSKSFGFAGLRIGWVVSKNPEILQKLADYKHYLSICNSAPSEWLANAILKNRELILEENHRLLTDNYRIVKSYFTKEPLFEWFEPKGGCTAYPRFRGSGPAIQFADKLLKSKGVVVLPDWVYQENSSHFRVSFGRKDCKQALKHFQDFIKENYPHANH